jgi:uncharacterized protein YndB with AHSA1/START domain
MNVITVTLEVDLAASPSGVWRALTKDIVHWWPRDFYVGSGPVGFHLEARPGGRMYEDWGDDQGLVWATVTAVERERWLLLSGELSADFGGPARTQLDLRFEAQGDGTRLRLTDTVYGQVAETTAASLESGWRQLFAEGFKRYVETGEKPALPATLCP